MESWSTGRAAIEQNTEVKGWSKDHELHLAQISWSRELGEHVLYCDGSLQGLAVPTDLAEMFM